MAHAAHPLLTRSEWTTLLLALGLQAGFAGATTLGDIDVGSAAGEVLDATITLGTAAGAPVGPECIFLSRGAPEDGPFVTRANVSVYEVAGERFLRLKSAEPVRDALTRLRVVVRCPGQPHVAYREYRALFAPRPTPAPIAAPVTAAGAERSSAVPAQPGAFPVRPGDTLQSLAALIFPRNPDAQRAYVEAMRSRNPAIAALGPRDPLPADATLELPDLRSLPRLPGRAAGDVALAPAPVARAPRAAEPRAPLIAEKPEPRIAEKPAPRIAEKPATRPALPVPPSPAPAAPATAPPRAAAPAAASGDKFVLRLSSPEVDLTRSRGIDDRMRAKLRERLLVLDSDDQVSALLSLRDSVKRLEGRVAELQLKLSTLPVTLPPPAPKVEPPKVEPPPPVKVEPPPPVKVEPPPPVKVVPPPPAKVEPPPPVKVVPPPPAKVEPPPPVKVVPPPKVAVAPPPAAAPAPQAAQKPTGARVPARPEEALPWMTIALWAGAALAALLLAALIWRVLRSRRAAGAANFESAVEEALPDVATSPPPPTTELPARRSAPVDIDVGERSVPVTVAPPAPEPRRREMASDEGLATEVHTGDPAALRRRYMEERFPEIANGTIVLGNPESVVKAARLFYEDGAVPRAVELLQYSTEDNAGEQKTWLALFEIYRLERLAGPFADLAERYRDLHGKSDNWRKVQYFGREVDPGNALYRDLAVGIETIKFEAGKPPAPVSFDPVAENWLDAPMDFENELLVVELRKALMAEGKVTDEDLVPNPMPALRSVEMFTVA